MSDSIYNWIVTKDNKTVEYLQGSVKSAELYAEKLHKENPDSEYRITGYEHEFNENIRFKLLGEQFSIREMKNGMYLTEENNGKYTFGKEEDRIIFYDEIEAEGVLEYLNNTTELCCVLLDENK